MTVIDHFHKRRGTFGQDEVLRILSVILKLNWFARQCLKQMMEYQVPS